MESDLSKHWTPHPACLELVDFLRRGRKIESETGKTSEQFEERASAFLNMFNGNIRECKPVHICSHSCLPASQRHCQCRDDAVQKCTNALMDLFLSCMPSIPTPNKWTTLFGPLDFVLSGCIVHAWLREVFSIAFTDMVFAEFDHCTEVADPKLIEALSFHAVNGKRHDMSLAFLQSSDAAWAIILLSIILEPNRVLTWYWLSCLNKSLKQGQRPPLYCILDPRTSVLVHVLQHFASLLMNGEGTGRLHMVWANTGYVTFSDFCQNEPRKVRELRRMLMLASGWIFRRHYLYLTSDPFVITLTGDSSAIIVKYETINNLIDTYMK